MTVQMISRAAASIKLDEYLGVWRNYEIERELAYSFGGSWCVSEWCPFNGRFCTLQNFAPKPHPFMNGEPKTWSGGKPKEDCSDDWKLPSIEELQAIADRMGPADIYEEVTP